MIGGLGFLAPYILATLVGLPILWYILRAIPPAPSRVKFPALRFLFGLKDDDQTAARTPWWLLLLRMVLIAAVIVAAAGPIFNANADRSKADRFLVLIDGSWPSAMQWDAALEVAQGHIQDTARRQIPVAIVQLNAFQTPVFRSVNEALTLVSTAEPSAQPAKATAFLEWLSTDKGALETLWISDGIEYLERKEIEQNLIARGGVQVLEPRLGTYYLRNLSLEDGQVHVVLERTDASLEKEVQIVLQGVDLAGNDAVLSAKPALFAEGEMQVDLRFDLLPELRARIRTAKIEGIDTAGAVRLAGQQLARKEVAILAEGALSEQAALLSPLTFATKALEPYVDQIEGSLSEVILANPDAIILADVANISESDTEALIEWVDKGGVLIRFAGPRVAAAEFGTVDDNPLMPVRLRQGGRSLGGAMSWGAPKKIGGFSEKGPFVGLTPPDDIAISAQVLAEPDPELAERTLALLEDGTPIVTRSFLGQGQVVLFHVTANTDWSTLPISGVFVQMLSRLVASSLVDQEGADMLEGQIWSVEQVLDGFGRLSEAVNLDGVDGAELVTAAISRDVPAGVYAYQNRIAVRNVVNKDTVITPATWSEGVTLLGVASGKITDFSGFVWMCVALLLCLDAIATLWIMGRFRKAPIGAMAILIALSLPPHAEAQQAVFNDPTLGFVVTGDQRVDDLSRAGLAGLSAYTSFRTSVELPAPVGVDLEEDEIAGFPLLYWPITDRQADLSQEAVAKLNAYLNYGGMLLVDTRDGDLGGQRANPDLQRLMNGVAVPRLEPVPLDHVLTRTFYLLQEFPGRYMGAPVWVEAAPADADQTEGVPFRNLNDGVSPVILGANDWAAAWAVDDTGAPMLPVGRGFTGERQREMAYRSGINIIMYVLTGNYKSDQVHVPALLDRLGQ
jgi:hypothetical protein